MRFSLTSAIAVALVALLAALVSSHSAFVLLWWAILTAVGHRLIFREQQVGSILLVYAFYCFLALVLYKTQLWTNPTFYGFSGDGMLNSVGTDDSFFYSLVAYDLPFDFPSRFAIMVQRHNYADVLSVLVAVHRRIFPTLHPLDLLFFNVFGLSFLPFFSRLVYRGLFPGDRADRWVFGLTLIAPFVLANGVILMRDGLVAMAFAGGIAAAQRRRWISLGWALLATSWLRPENGIMLAAVVLILVLAYRRLDDTRMVWRRPDSGLRLTLELAGFAVLGLAVTQIVFHIPWWDLLFRGDFLRMYIGQGAALESGTSTFYALSQLPLPLRIPLTLLFYLGSPFLALGALRAKGMWVPRAFLTNMFALMFPLYAAWFYRGVMRVIRIRHRGGLIFLALFLINLSLITQASMQLRHKIPLQPMFYVIVAYGLFTPYSKDRAWGWVVALAVIALNVAFNFLQLAGR